MLITKKFTARLNKFFKIYSFIIYYRGANGNNLKSREKVMIGAMYAGIAFCNSSVALVHGMSRPIGANFHIAHGISNAAILGTREEIAELYIKAYKE